MQEAVRKGSKLASTIKVTICSQAEADRLMAQEIIIAGNTRVTYKYFDIATNVQYPTCPKCGQITLPCSNPEHLHCFLFAGDNVTRNHKCDVHEYGCKKCKSCSYTIAQYYNCDGKHFTSASAYSQHQWAIETSKTSRAERCDREYAEQEARIVIKAEENVESITDMVATMAEGIDSSAGTDPGSMELTADEEEDTDEHMDGTISEHWADAGVDST